MLFNVFNVHPSTVAVCVPLKRHPLSHRQKFPCTTSRFACGSVLGCQPDSADCATSVCLALLEGLGQLRSHLHRGCCTTHLAAPLTLRLSHSKQAGLVLDHRLSFVMFHQAVSRCFLLLFLFVIINVFTSPPPSPPIFFSFFVCLLF